MQFISLEFRSKHKVVEIGTKHLNDMVEYVNTRSRVALPLSTIHNNGLITFLCMKQDVCLEVLLSNTKGSYKILCFYSCILCIVASYSLYE